MNNENEIIRLKNRLKAADDVVSYIVIFGAAPTDRLAELVSICMEQRQRDLEVILDAAKRRIEND